MSEVHDYLKRMYTGTVAVDFEHVRGEMERTWLYENFENAMTEKVSPSEKIKML